MGCMSGQTLSLAWHMTGFNIGKKIFAGLIFHKNSKNDSNIMAKLIIIIIIIIIITMIIE